MNEHRITYDYFSENGTTISVEERIADAVRLLVTENDVIVIEDDNIICHNEDELKTAINNHFGHR